MNRLESLIIAPTPATETGGPNWHPNFHRTGLGITPFGALAGVVTRLAIGVGYPVLCNFITEWNHASTAKLVYSTGATGGSAFVTGLPSLLSEEALLKFCTLFFVDKQFAVAKALMEQAGNAKALRNTLRARGLRGAVLGEARKQMARTLVEQANNVRAAGDLSRVSLVGLKVIGPALQGLSCWFAYKGAEQNAADYWKTLEQGGI